MTKLAPDIVQAIVNGATPRHLNLHAVRGTCSIGPNPAWCAGTTEK